MINEETKKFAELYISCCTDFLFGKIAEDHYKNMMKLFSERLNEVAIPITQRTYTQDEAREIFAAGANYAFNQFRAPNYYTFFKDRFGIELQ